jgi:hypothetical protein
MNGMEKCLFEFSSFQRFKENLINTIVANDEVTSRLFCTFCINLHLISFQLNLNSTLFPLIIALSLTVWSNAEPKFDKVREGLMPLQSYILW